jgi:hypothetical protein
MQKFSKSMKKLSYDELKFIDFDNKKIKVMFKGKYYFHINKKDLDQIFIKWKLKSEDQNTIYYEGSIKRSIKKFENLIDQGLDNLYNTNKNKRTAYIYEGLIPLIGTNEFGIVDRDTSILEIKPSTGCNLSCVFCSVSEGVNDKIDYLIEPNYLVKEIKKITDLKKSESIEINIGPQGEPLLYPDMCYLIKELKKIKKIKIISMNTNGRLLNKKLLEKLIAAGLDRINLSVHNMNEEKQKQLSGAAMSIKLLKQLIDCYGDKIEIFLAPVYIPKLNEDIEPLIEFAKNYKKGPRIIGIQNFLNYKGGRNPVKQISFDDFYDMLAFWEQKHKVKLKLNPEDYNIVKDKVLKKPFKKGQIINAIIKLPGRRKNEVIAEASNRAITVYDCKFEFEKSVRIKIIRDKHNIFSGVRN